MGGGGGGDSTSIIHTNLLPTYIPGLQGWVEEYLVEAANLSGSNFTPYPDDTYAPQTADETDGIAAVAERGRFGAQVELDGKAYLRNLYDGLYIDSNPKRDTAYEKKVEELLETLDDDILPGIRNSFVFAFGGSEHNVAEAKAARKMMAKLDEIAVGVYYEDHRHERALQQQGMSHATPYGLQCIRDMEMLRQAGVYAREYAQGSYLDAWQRWTEDKILAVRGLDVFGNSIRTIMSTQRTATQKYYKPPAWTQIAGVAMAGLSLYSMFSGTSLSPYSNPKAAQGGVNLSGDPRYKLDSPMQGPGGNFFDSV